MLKFGNKLILDPPKILILCILETKIFYIQKGQSTNNSGTQCPRQKSRQEKPNKGWDKQEAPNKTE